MMFQNIMTIVIPNEVMYLLGHLMKLDLKISATSRGFSHMRGLNFFHTFSGGGQRTKFFKICWLIPSKI